jgi:superfamily I DNA/RNA helicase
MILAVDKGRVPRGQYSSILIDEGHDFEAAWFKLIVQMLDPVTDSLLLVYDDVQSIYKRRKPKSWAGVGINVPGGRSKILKLNYRNTAEAIDFAYGFVSEYLDAQSPSEAIPLVKPEQSLRHGEKPLIKEFPFFGEEMRFLSGYFSDMAKQGVPLRSIAVLCRTKHQVESVRKELRRHGLDSVSTLNGKVSSDAIRVLTMHSSKGLEFHTVAIPDLGCMPHAGVEEEDEARVLYVAMTRATEQLLLTHHSRSKFTKQLSDKINSIA